VLARAGVPKLGLAAYLALTFLVTFAVAVLSWHLIEKQALKLKDWTPAPLLRVYRNRESAEGGVLPPPAEAHTVRHD